MLLVLHGFRRFASGGVTPCEASPPLQKGCRVAVICDHDAILADLTETILFRQIIAEIVSTIRIGGSVLPRGGRADHVKAHLVSFHLMPIVWRRSGRNGAISGQSLNRPLAAEWEYNELPHGLYQIASGDSFNSIPLSANHSSS